MDGPSLVEKARAFLQHRQYAYRKTFGGNYATPVLQDLAQFCRATESTFHDSERVANILEGRRQVWLRIQSHLKLPESELWRLLSGGDIDDVS